MPGSFGIPVAAADPGGGQNVGTELMMIFHVAGNNYTDPVWSS